VLAQDALKVGQEAPEAATRITAYRIAGVSAWQHSPTDPLIEQARTAGLEVCENLSESEIGAPRDCAILRYLKIMVAYEQIALAMNGLSEPTAANLNAIQEQQLVIQMAALGTTEQSAWADITSSKRAYAGMNPATRDYFKAITFVSACLVEIAHRKGQAAAGSGEIVPPDYQPTVETAEQQFLPVLKATQLLKDENAESWFGSDDISCSEYLSQNNQAPSLLTQK